MKNKALHYQLKHIIIPMLMFCVILIYDIWFYNSGKLESRKFDNFINDIRAMNEYCNNFLQFIAILMGLLFRDIEHLKNTKLPVAPFFLAIITSSFSILFIPIEYGTEGNAPELLWLRGLIAEQCTVIFASYGLLVVLVSIAGKMKNNKDSPNGKSVNPEVKMDYEKSGGNYSEYRKQSVTEWVLGHLEVAKILEPLKGKKVLDYGCGDGIFSRFIEEKGSTVVGVDRSARMIEIAKQKNSPNIEYHVIDSGKLDFLSPGSFDCAVCNFVLCAVHTKHEIIAIMEGINKILKKGGTFVILNPNWVGFNGKSGISFHLEKHDQIPGQKTCSVLKLSPPLKVDNYYWPLADYKLMLEVAGFKVRQIMEPKGTGDDYNWLDEKEHSPTLIISAAKR